MSWTSPPSYTPGQIIGATDMNILRDNFNYLESGQPDARLCYSPGSNYTTSSTSFVPVDTTNLRLTATVNSGRFRATVICGVSVGGAIAEKVYLGGLADTSVRETGGHSTYGMAAASMANAVGVDGPQEVTYIMSWTGLSVGSHTFDLAWSVSVNTNPATMYGTTQSISMVGWEY